MASIRIIPATIHRASAQKLSSAAKRRVAAYARVSTDSEEQLTSYEAQVDYYTKYIRIEKTGILLRFTQMKAFQQQIPSTVKGLMKWWPMHWLVG